MTEQIKQTTVVDSSCRKMAEQIQQTSVWRRLEKMTEQIKQTVVLRVELENTDRTDKTNNRW